MCLQVALTFVAALCWQQFVAAVTQRAAVAVRHAAPKQNVPALVCADITPIEAIELQSTVLLWQVVSDGAQGTYVNPLRS